MSRWRLVLVTCPGVGIRSVLVWLKRRWKCDNPGCGRATFTEVVPQVSAGVCGLSWPRTHQGLHRAR